MTTDELIRKVLLILPDAELGEDNDGQIVIYTGLTEQSAGTVTPMAEGGER